MSAFTIQRRNDFGERRAGLADTLQDAERLMLTSAARELDSLVCRDRRVCAVASSASVLLVDLRLGRLIVAYTFREIVPDVTPESADHDDTGAPAIVLELPVPDRNWPERGEP